MNEQQYSLSGLLGGFKREKLLLFYIPLLSLIISLIIVFYFTKPLYEATTLVKVNVPEAQQKSLLANIEEIKSDVGLKKVLKNISNSDQMTSINNLRQNISIELIKDTPLIKIKVKSNDSEKSKQVSNAFALELANNFETSDLSTQIEDSKKKLDEVDDKLIVVQREVSETEKQLEQVPEKLVTQKSLADDPFLQSVIHEGTNNKNIDALKLTSEEVNDIYIKLKSNLATAHIEMSKLEANKKYLQDKISVNLKKIDDLTQYNIQNKDTLTNFVQVVSDFRVVNISPALDTFKYTKKFSIVAITTLFAMLFGIVVTVLKKRIKK